MAYVLQVHGCMCARRSVTRADWVHQWWLPRAADPERGGGAASSYASGAGTRHRTWDAVPALDGRLPQGPHQQGNKHLSSPTLPVFHYNSAQRQLGSKSTEPKVKWAQSQLGPKTAVSKNNWARRLSQWHYWGNRYTIGHKYPMYHSWA